MTWLVLCHRESAVEVVVVLRGRGGDDFMESSLKIKNNSRLLHNKSAIKATHRERLKAAVDFECRDPRYGKIYRLERKFAKTFCLFIFPRTFAITCRA